ncbi:MAG: ABC transporter permease [Oscillospiraceae bacterium]|nr:ABC transporter permease [Oscillospiraceae bacterium]
MGFIKFLIASVNYSAPLMFGTSGEILSEKAGNLNLGVEGMMWIGAFAGFYAALKTDSLILAVFASFLSAALLAFVYAFLTVTLRANQNVTGLTLTAFGIGLSRVLGDKMVRSAGGSTYLSERLDKAAGSLDIPLLGKIPFIGELFFNYNIMIYFGIFICIIMSLYLNRTRLGLNLRAAGENPAAADASGINVTLVKYASILVGGGICGIGGAYMSIITGNGLWQSGGIVNGFGWISVALVIFVSWKPAMAAAGAIVFGAFSALQFYKFIEIPTAIYQMLPFLLTAAVLVASSARKSSRSAQPAALGVNYFREDR